MVQLKPVYLLIVAMLFSRGLTGQPGQTADTLFRKYLSDTSRAAEKITELTATAFKLLGLVAVLLFIPVFIGVRSWVIHTFFS